MVSVSPSPKTGSSITNDRGNTIQTNREPDQEQEPDPIMVQETYFQTH